MRMKGDHFPVLLITKSNKGLVCDREKKISTLKGADPLPFEKRISIKVNQFVMTTVDFLHRGLQPRSNATLFEYFLCEQLSSFHKIPVLGTSPITAIGINVIN